MSDDTITKVAETFQPLKFIEPGITYLAQKRPPGYEPEPPPVGFVAFWVGADDHIHVKTDSGERFRIPLSRV